MLLSLKFIFAVYYPQLKLDCVTLQCTPRQELQNILGQMQRNFQYQQSLWTGMFHSQNINQ